ncbi:MAG: hypothetical protein M0D55_12185 [Elusimicrobiota bacterium]|nr:MAG: hypothetical protein M0D55_12185 [Elusimicrobiota bacterium]
MKKEPRKTANSAGVISPAPIARPPSQTIAAMIREPRNSMSGPDNAVARK